MLLLLPVKSWTVLIKLEERKTRYEETEESTNLYGQLAELPGLKRQRPALNLVYSQSLQNVGVRLDLAFKSFFRRVRQGEKSGFPRFKGKGYKSFTYPQCPKNGSPFRIDGDRIKLAKVGEVKIKLHRKLRGTPKTCTVKKTATGKWFVTIVCDDAPKIKVEKSKKKVGIDVGITTFATFSDGKKIKNPRFFRSEEKELSKAQRKLSKAKKASKKRKRKKVVARIYERITNKRENFCHKKTRRIVDKYGTISVEDLSIANMIVKGKKSKLSKSIQDASWGLFLSLLSFKAESAGRTFVKVNPAYTTQDCSSCGTRRKIGLSVRRYECRNCGLSINRDLNAAKNILSVGLYTLASA